MATLAISHMHGAPRSVPHLSQTRSQPDSNRMLQIALGVSVVLHLVLLSLHFELPTVLERASARALDVILVNSKSATKPTTAQAKAQANLVGGGNTDENRIASTPLPPSPQVKDGNDLVEAQRRVARLEAEQQQLMTQAKSKKVMPAQKGQPDPAPVAPTAMSGLDMASSAMAMARLEAQIEKNLDAYNKRPRRKNIGANVEEYRFAQYVEDWRQKIERIGNLNYPDAARGKLYGSLVLSVVIRSDGSVDKIEVTRSSGHKELDDAAKRIVQLAGSGGFARFPEAIRKDYEILEISRTWTFTSSDRLQTN